MKLDYNKIRSDFRLWLNEYNRIRPSVRILLKRWAKEDYWLKR